LGSGGRSEELADSRHLLVSSLLAQGRSAEALEAMRDIGEDEAAMYGVLVDDLHGDIARKAAPSMRAGNYGEAIMATFKVVEEMIRERSSRLDEGVRPNESAIWRHRKAWLEHGTDVPHIPVDRGVESFGHFIQGCFGILRNSVTHKNVELTAADAFASIAAGHLIVRVMDHGGLPWCACDEDPDGQGAA
jgi:hypothetical protein